MSPKTSGISIGGTGSAGSPAGSPAGAACLGAVSENGKPI